MAQMRGRENGESGEALQRPLVPLLTAILIVPFAAALADGEIQTPGAFTPTTPEKVLNADDSDHFLYGCPPSRPMLEAPRGQTVSFKIQGTRVRYAILGSNVRPFVEHSLQLGGVEVARAVAIGDQTEESAQGIVLFPNVVLTPGIWTISEGGVAVSSIRVTAEAGGDNSSPDPSRTPDGCDGEAGAFAPVADAEAAEAWGRDTASRAMPLSSSSTCNGGICRAPNYQRDCRITMYWLKLGTYYDPSTRKFQSYPQFAPLKRTGPTTADNVTAGVAVWDLYEDKCGYRWSETLRCHCILHTEDAVKLGLSVHGRTDFKGDATWWSLGMATETADSESAMTGDGRYWRITHTPELVVYERAGAGHAQVPIITRIVRDEGTGGTGGTAEIKLGLKYLVNQAKITSPWKDIANLAIDTIQSTPKYWNVGEFHDETFHPGWICEDACIQWLRGLEGTHTFGYKAQVYSDNCATTSSLIVKANFGSGVMLRYNHNEDGPGGYLLEVDPLEIEVPVKCGAR